MQEEQIFGSSGIKIILIEKKEYYLIYNHDDIPQLTKEKYDNITKNKEPDINLGKIILYDKQKTKDGKYIRITPIYRAINIPEEMDVDIENEDESHNNNENKDPKEGILMTDSINLNLLKSDFSLLNKVMMILEGRNSSNLLIKAPIQYNFPYLNNKNDTSQGQNNNKQDNHNNKRTNEVLKIDFNEKKLKIISIVNKGINMILFSIDINIDYILDLRELLNLSMKNFQNKIDLINHIDKSFKENLKVIDELNLKKTTMTRINKEKTEQLMNFIVEELNKKKKNNYLLNEKLNSSFTGPEDKKEENKVEKIDEDKESDISIDSIVEDDNRKDREGKNENDKNNDNKNINNKEENKDIDSLSDSNLSLTDL